MIAATSRSSAFLQTTFPMLSVSTSDCRPAPQRKFRSQALINKQYIGQWHKACRSLRTGKLCTTRLDNMDDGLKLQAAQRWNEPPSNKALCVFDQLVVCHWILLGQEVYRGSAIDSCHLHARNHVDQVQLVPFPARNKVTISPRCLLVTSPLEPNTLIAEPFMH